MCLRPALNEPVQNETIESVVSKKTPSQLEATLVTKGHLPSIPRKPCKAGCWLINRDTSWYISEAADNKKDSVWVGALVDVLPGY